MSCQVFIQKSASLTGTFNELPSYGELNGLFMKKGG